MAERDGRTQFAVAGWLFGSASVVLGLVIHAAAGHTVPAAPIVVATAALLSLAGAAVTRLGVPNWALLVLAGVGQQVIHWAFAFFSNPLATTTLAGHGHAAAAQFTGPGLLLAGVPTQPLHVLLYAHVAAALLTFLLVQRLKKSAPKRFSPGAAAYPR
ncbi:MULTISPECIES: hypothetical protein [unclassified Arthrobacter]|uniref:hypothetical protein n=1 Tax=unclassified Arthrobacter TaxID=235627 RepID=UPI001F3704F9|nr:hypothetical protein [Arthrobacter sp. FW305-BF8]UKA53583.1 hypothetical protein LFT45_17960 [Arthrobacter sp. FW305-BF8]